MQDVLIKLYKRVQFKPILKVPQQIASYTLLGIHENSRYLMVRRATASMNTSIDACESNT